MASLPCPICGKRFDPEQTPTQPFCSPRCRDIDLGRWLSEKYTLPKLPEEPEEQDEIPPPPNAAGPADEEQES